ncbi:MAG: hypothetical protein AAGE84_01930 [Cyanobacteria bacterium P01_G01_bin.39]
MKINDLTNNSSFTELSSDEAAKINGDSGWYPNLFNDIFYPSIEFDSIPAGYLEQNRELLTSYVPDFSTSGIAGIDANVAGILTPLALYG